MKSVSSGVDGAASMSSCRNKSTISNLSRIENGASEASMSNDDSGEEAYEPNEDSRSSDSSDENGMNWTIDHKGTGNESNVKCDICNQVFSHNKHLRRHHERQHSLQDIPCPHCKNIFNSRYDFRMHYREHHLSTKGPFYCPFPDCHRKFSKREHLTRHQNASHTTLSSPQTQSDAVKTKDQDSVSSKPFRCDLCGATFTYKHGLTRHMLRSHDNPDRPFQCEQCLQRFKKKTDLQAHSFVHTGLSPFPCPHCSQSFLKKYKLNQHLSKSHRSLQNTTPTAQISVLFCDFLDCNETFSSEEDKRKHVEDTHKSEDQPEVEDNRSKLVCQVCSREFQKQGALRLHLRTHFQSLDERKTFECPVDECGKKYTKKSNWMAHYNAVHDEVKSKRFKCTYEGCEAAFGYKTTLRRHVEKIHEHPEPPKKRQRKTKSIREVTLGLQQGASAIPSVENAD